MLQPSPVEQPCLVEQPSPVEQPGGAASGEEEEMEGWLSNLCFPHSNLSRAW